ncbi:hypothetical protein EVAR_24700_1 [Eumeta japonica]|uniref:Uncharacterized protein n=1 Tax=Eumeta variegata TaxID=151549 RepID=A0A4C1WGY5_EUMVA|nr:hypothetical protein EVAR_24700_1 [Eumeta japonica]
MTVDNDRCSAAALTSYFRRFDTRSRAAPVAGGLSAASAAGADARLPQDSVLSPLAHRKYKTFEYDVFHLVTTGSDLYDCCSYLQPGVNRRGLRTGEAVVNRTRPPSLSNKTAYTSAAGQPVARIINSCRTKIMKIYDASLPLPRCKNLYFYRLQLLPATAIQA